MLRALPCSVSNATSEKTIKAMAKERENFSKTNIATAPDSGVPVFSFNASESSEKLVPERFDIHGNQFTAFYDSAHRLIFVLDETRTENTPNALLVMADKQGRKWDDVLGNDYKMDLEEIRPKKNNKYQKLDIDYHGLPIYGQLIADFKTGNDMVSALNAMNGFRAEVGHQIARARLNAAMREIETATATIEKTEDAIAKLHAQIKTLKSKLSKTRSEIGKKPTKESAAKILKIQAQTDTATEKEKRAKARLRRAKKRLEDAQKDMDAARKALDAAAPKQEKKPKEPEMAEEPKPLFNKDPEILDNKIAFQPIGFETPSFIPPEPINYDTPISEPKPVATPDAATLRPPMQMEPIVVAPVVNATMPLTAPEPVREIPTVIPQPAPIPQQTMPAPMAERPYSPVTGQTTMVTQPVIGTKKPTMIYYVLLIFLIGLSVLTLWLYQSKMDNSTAPNLTAPKMAQTQPAPMPAASESAFIDSEPVAAPQPQPATQPQPGPMPEMAEPVASNFAEQPVPAPTPDFAEPIPAPDVQESEPMQTVEPEMAAPSYPAPAPENNMAAPVQNDAVVKTGATSCTSGTAPDEDGCCAGENLKWIESYNGYGCCSPADGECYPPLK